MDIDIKAPPEIVAAFLDARREGIAWTTWCPRCSKSHRASERKLRCLIYKGKPWWGCMRCQCEKEYKANEWTANLRFKNMGDGDDERQRREAARQILESRTSHITTGDAVDRYLRQTRKLSPMGLAWPGNLRIATLKHFDAKATTPCMVAIVSDVSGTFSAIHRTFLYELPDRTVVKLNDKRVPEDMRVGAPKLSLGPLTACAIRLGVDSDEIGIAEGIESALGLAKAIRLVCWSAISASGMQGIAIPSNVRRVVIGPDIGDKSGVGVATAYALRSRIIQDGKRNNRRIDVEIKPPPFGLRDWAEIHEPSAR